MQAGRLTPLTAYATSKSVIDETAYLFLAHDLTAATAQPDLSEDLQVHTVDITEAGGRGLARERGPQPRRRSSPSRRAMRP